MRCLLIDDNPVDLLVNAQVMANCFEGLEIVKVQSGEEALKLLQDSETLPEIILLDINMPAMNGFEFLKEYNRFQEKAYSKIQIFILSSSLDPDDMNKADNESQVRDFLQKPLKIEDVKVKIRNDQK